MKIRVIDLLNKIAKGEEVPKEIKWNGVSFDYVEEEDYEDYINLNGCSLFEHLGDKNKIYKVTNMLNDEVEIIEDKKDKEIEEDKKIEKLGLTYLKDDDRNEIIDKINEIIDYLNKDKES